MQTRECLVEQFLRQLNLLCGRTQLKLDPIRCMCHIAQPDLCLIDGGLNFQQ